MHVPALTGLKDSTQLVNTTGDAIRNSSNASDDAEVVRKARSLGRSSAVLNRTKGTSRSTPAKKEQVQGLNEKQSSCANGKAFYRCANGFTGCCSVDPCNPGKTCPDDQKSSAESTVKETSKHHGTAASHLSEHLTKTRTKTDEKTETETKTGDRTGSRTSDSTKSTGHHKTSDRTSSIHTASSTGHGRKTSTSSSSQSSPSASLAPSCPAANSTTYSDSSKIQYHIHCNSDNTYSSDNTIAVGTGGYAECFSACSKSLTCAGFTYVGTDSGNCYLKGKMPQESYVTKAGSNYISCSKLDPNAAPPSIGKGGSSNSHKKVGAIVGGVVGSIAFLLLLLLLVACLSKRKRKKIEEQRATVTQVSSGPIETQQLDPSGHQRQGSTSHDVFQPFGGSYYAPPHTRQRSIYRDQQWV